ncbi:stalk domain-containing protein [Paenibacillus thalictri]|uniref:Copper amine oxidase N-terminal domain-containing protein n=1 Tax=Paenibacillus thalictri TaxID=2527873 RepID=A0A4Q9DTJ4_9BACL|nr:stalk domain-containing protein [Paenibacillus thalictri]TBL80228.1 copper amine oxidase N-terminal domain-containing protein [Paenibacillus thalictri]
MKKKLLIAFVGLSMLWLSNFAWAESKLSQIDVMFGRINVAINGQQADLNKDSIVYNGSIYVPLRSLSEMLGAEVSWNDKTQTVNLDFLNDKRDLLFSATQKGLYQYVALQNNQIMSDMITFFKTDDMNGIKQSVDRYERLRVLADNMNDNEMAQLFDKLKSATELIRSGWETKSMDDYYIAWNIFSSNADKLNKLLKSKLAG